MSETKNRYASVGEIENFITQRKKGSLILPHKTLENYPGMGLAILLFFDFEKETYHLNLEWICYGLDLYGDTLQESYVYRFNSLMDVLSYVETQYGISVQHIPIKFQFDQKQFPNPIENAHQKPEFEAAWARFQVDFRQGNFLDDSLELNYSSLETE